MFMHNHTMLNISSFKDKSHFIAMTGGCIAIVLSFTLLLTCLFPLFSNASEGDTEPQEFRYGAFTYIINEEDTITIVDFFDGEEAFVDENDNVYTPTPYDSGSSIVIPANIDGRNVTVIGEEAFKFSKHIENVQIPDTVKVIDHGAFMGCKLLRSVVIPEGVEEIRGHAFFACDNLESVSIPASVTSISYGPFESDYNLTSITISEDNPVFQIIDNALVDTRDGILKCYLAGAATTSYTIPEEIVMIESYAFSGCRNLEEIIVPEGVITIDSGAFEDCENLKTVTLPASLEMLYSNPFSGCTSLENVEISQDNPYYTIKDGFLITSDHALLFPLSSEEKYIIPDGIVSLCDYAFEDQENLIQVTLPEGLETIGSFAFAYCKALEMVNIPESVNDISSYAFSGNYNLTLLVVPESYGEEYAIEKEINYVYSE